MRFLLVSAAKDLRRRLADLPGLAVWLGIPIVIGTLMTLAFGGSDAAPKALVLLADEGTSILGRLTGGVSSSEAGQYLAIERVTAEEGRRRLDAGEGSALVILPKGLTDAVINRTPATITVVTNPAQRILPDVVRVGVEMLAEALFYLQQILGDALKAFASSPQDDRGFFADAMVSAFSADVNQRLRALKPLLFPPLLSVKTTSESSAASGASFAALLVPSVLFMSLLFIGRGFSDDLWEEREAGTLRRAVVAPPGPAVFLGGKLAAGAVFMSAVSLAGLLAIVPAAGVSWLRLPPAFLWCAFTGTALISLFTVLQFLASTARGANILTTMVLFPLMMVGGSLLPFEMMPGWMAAAGRLTPNGQGVAQLRAILEGRSDPAGLAVATAAIGLPALACFVLSARLLRGRFAAGV
jgi:ABC-type multidrug transport system permease subunit